MIADESDVPFGFQFETLPVLPEHYETASEQVEKDLLGLIMLGELRGIELIDPGWFSCPGNFLIFDALLRLYQGGVNTDVVTVSEYLERVGHLQRVGGLAPLGELARNAPSFGMFRDLAKLLEGFALMRYRLGHRQGPKLLMPLADAIAVGALHGKSWVLTILDLHNYQQVPYIGDHSALLDEDGVRVCYAYLDVPDAD